MIKKRTIIAIIITIVTIIATNKLWLIFKPMPVDFYIKGKGQCNIEVQLNKKDNDEFNKIKSQCIILDLNKDSHASFNVKRSRCPKRIRFVITGLKDNSPVEISNITLRNGKYKLDDLKQFANSTGKLGIKNNSVIVSAGNSIIILEYKKTLKVRTAINFDFKLFVIISVLTYLLAYKFSSYVADFKTVENKSRIDIIFLIIFFVFLFIPMSNINKDEISAQENRTLAKLQPFINQDGEINDEFGKNFNEWFNDRFYLRYSFIGFYNQIHSKFLNIVKTKDGIYNKKSNYMFVDDSGWYSSLYDEQVQEEIVKNLNRFNSFCQNNNIKLYLLVVPWQQDIYYKEGEPYLSVPDARYKLIDKIAGKTSFKTINTYNELQKASQNIQTYYKTDWHWTDDGAFIGYQLLMDNIKKDFKKLNILTKNDFNITQSNKVRSDWDREFHNGEVMMYHFHDFENQADKILDAKYNYYEHKQHKNLQATSIDIPYKKEKTYYYPFGNNLRLMQIGTSMNESLLQFTPYSFKNLKYIRLINVKEMSGEENFKLSKYYQSEILQYKPDIIVLCLTPINLPNVIDFYKE